METTELTITKIEIDSTNKMPAVGMQMFGTELGAIAYAEKTGQDRYYYFPKNFTYYVEAK